MKQLVKFITYPGLIVGSLFLKAQRTLAIDLTNIQMQPLYGVESPEPTPYLIGIIIGGLFLLIGLPIIIIIGLIILLKKSKKKK